MMQLESNLGRDNVKTLVAWPAIPSVLTQFVSVFYSIVDRMYIGNISGVRELVPMGVGICGPIVMLISSFSALVGFDGAPLLAIRMGEKNTEVARRVVASSFMMLVALAVCLTGAFLLLKDHLLIWFGASEATFPYASQYITIYLCGTVFALIAAGTNQFIIRQSFAKIGMKSVMFGAIVNLVLNPVFIFGFHMDVSGAAPATVLAQAYSAIHILLVLFGKKVPAKITFSGFDRRVYGRILALGFSPSIITALDNVLIIAINIVLQTYGGPEQGDMMVTYGTIMQSFMLMATMPLGGITAGTQSILGYNYGSRQVNRVRHVKREILKITILFTVVMFLLSQTCSRFFVLILTRNPEYITMSVRAIRISTLMIIPLAVQYMVVDGSTGMGIAKIAIPLSLYRKLLFFTAVTLLPRYFGVGAMFYAESTVDIAVAVMLATVHQLVCGRILKKRLLEGRRSWA